jgi:BirA family biotin operon repressor/biotin-[acetyl-CoA-carboxylase] ligase
MSPPFVRTQVERSEVESTSDLARTLLESPAIELPLVVRARRQTRGRGRGDNNWWSDDGSLTFTLAIDPASLGLRPELEPRIALATAVAVVETFAPVIPLQIRWPNDLEVEGRKLGGILPERIETPLGVRILIGIGLNVDSRLDDAPPEIRRMAVSLRDIAGASPVDIDALFKHLLEQVGLTLERLARDDADLAERWGQLDALRESLVLVDVGSWIITGIGSGIDKEGALLVETERETIRLLGGRVLREPPAAADQGS